MKLIMYKIKIIILVLVSYKSIAQNHIKTQINILKDSVYLGENLRYGISITKELDSDIWVYNLDLNKGAEIFILNHNREIHLYETSISTCWGCDDRDREIYYAPFYKKTMNIQNNSYDLFQKNNKIEDYIQADTFRVKLSFLTSYYVPSQKQKVNVKEFERPSDNWRIVYYQDIPIDSIVAMSFDDFRTYNTEIQKTIYLKKFYGIDEKAYHWLKKKNLFWVLFQPYDEKINYSGLKSFIKKFPNSFLTLKAQKVYADIIYQKKEREAIELYTNILSSSNNDIYGVKNPSAQMLKYIQDSKEREKEIDLYKKQLKNKKNTQ